jgi:hypothetical protein
MAVCGTEQAFDRIFRKSGQRVMRSFGVVTFKTVFAAGTSIAPMLDAEP